MVIITAQSGKNKLLTNLQTTKFAPCAPKGAVLRADRNHILAIFTKIFLLAQA